jgi:hypothetical protein
MRLEQIKDQIAANNDAIKKLQLEISQLSKDNVKLNNGYDDKLIEYFKDYIELGSTYNVHNRYLYFTGVQTGVKKDDKQYSPNFNDGDAFEFIKKNAKSIVIKCTKKVHLTFSNGKRSERVESNPGWTFRVEIESLYQNLIREEDFKKSFNKYVMRKEALELLGI